MNKKELVIVENLEDGSRVKFEYDGIPGQYTEHSGKIPSSVYYDGRYIDFVDSGDLETANQTFNMNDLQFILALSEIIKETYFPITLESGERVNMLVEKDWELNMAARLFAELPDSESFQMKDGKLYIDGKEKDIVAESKVYEMWDGPYTYGVESDPSVRREIIVSKKAKAGCRMRSVLHFLSTLDIEGLVSLRFSPRDMTFFESADLSLKSEKVSRIPVSIVSSYRIEPEVDDSTGIIESYIIACKLEKAVKS